MSFQTHVLILEGPGNGIRFGDGNPDMTIYVSPAADGDWGGRMEGDTKSITNMYFKMPIGPGGYVFKNGDLTVAGIDHNGNLRLKGAASFKHNVQEWVKTTDDFERIYFVRSGRNIYKSGDGWHEWRNSGDSSHMLLEPTGNLMVAGTVKTNTSKFADGGLWVGESGDIIDGGDHYATMRFGMGVRITSGNKSGEPKITLGSDGNILAAGNFVGQSDERMKTNIRALEDCLGLALALEPSRFIHGGKESIGFIAQKVQGVVPELVLSDPAGILHLNYSNLTAVAVGATKELHSLVQEQKAVIDDLTARMEALEAMIRNMVGDGK